MLKLVEPNRGIVLLKNLNGWMNSSQDLIYLMPVFADIFVFVYPVFLLGFYVMGWIKKNIYYKKASMFIFSGTFLSVCINIFVQLFVDKVRPNIILGLMDQKTETILNKFLPSSSFPSDHAAVSMGFAMSTLLRGIKYKDRKFIWFGMVFVIFSLVMCFARITIAVHWPTDIIGGFLVAILAMVILSNRKIFEFFDKIFYWIGKKI